MESSSKADEKRRFTRVPFVNRITLSQGELQWEGTVVDVSLNGILINCEELAVMDTEKNISSTIHFENDSHIQAKLELAHHNENLYGFHFNEIDIESIGHLRNIITHNLGNGQACERELMTLFRYHQ